MLTIPNFERLKVFHLVYLNRSIQKAADVLGITRSAVSQSLKGLEQELGLPLFIRDSKKFQATPPADTLFKAIDPFVTELHTTLRQIESGKRTPSGVLRIGAPQDFGSDYLTRVLAKFSKKFPELSFELQLAVPVKLLEKLGRAELDLAFIDNADVHTERYPVTIQHTIREDFVLVASAQSFEKYRLKDASLVNLGKAPFVDYLPGAPVTRMWFKYHFAKIAGELKVIYSAESVRAVLTAIKGDLGIGVVPSRLLVGEFKDLKVVATLKKPFVNKMMIARQAGRAASAKEAEFIRFLQHHELTA